MEYAVGLFLLVAGRIIRKLALRFVGILVASAIASASGGSFSVAALYAVYAGLAAAVIGTIFGAAKAVFSE